MTSPSTQASELTRFPAHSFRPESCPTCGQQIPPDKFEEISGKIAARERERRLAIAAELEKQYASERIAALAKAKAELEAERERSAARELEVREEARQQADKLINDQLQKAGQDQQNLVNEWQQRIDAAESKLKSAEEVESRLRSTIEEHRRASVAEHEAMEAEAKRREVEIRHEANRDAESAIATRIQAAERARLESEASLQAKIDDAEAGRIAAVQNEEALKAEIARIKEDAANEAVRVQQIASERAELRYRDTVAAHEKAVDEAKAKARDAEKHALEIEQDMKTQRESLEQAKEEAINAEKAKAFEENQKLSSKVNDLQRALEKKTNEELGEGAEVNVFEALRKEFKDDRIERIPKGAPGADIRHVVRFRGQECGTILYDSKNHKQWRDDHAAKLRRDQLAEKAEHAILSIHKFPRDVRQLGIRDGVLLANPARVVTVASIIRQHLVQLHTLRLSKVERESKTIALYDFITSERCKQLLDRIDQRSGTLLDLQEKEIKWHERNWEHQGTAIRAIQKAKGDLEGEIDSIISNTGTETDMPEVS
jgi:hypothetical protein